MPGDIDTRRDSIEHEHTPAAIRERLAEAPRLSYLRDWIYGGVDGTVTTFAIVSGVAGAKLSPQVIVILGVANLFADGLAMAAGNYLATRSEHEELHYTAAIEQRHIDTVPAGEREEVREIFRQYGFADDLLERIVDAITANRERWVQTMLRAEYGLPATLRSEWRAAGATFSAFVLCGLIPLVPFIAGVRNAFPVAAVATAIVFAVIGALKSRWSVRRWWRSAFETLAIGCATAAVAYGVGAWLKDLAG